MPGNHFSVGIVSRTKNGCPVHCHLPDYIDHENMTQKKKVKLSNEILTSPPPI